MWLIVVVKVMLVNVIVGQLLAAVNNLAIAKLEAVPTLNSGFSSMAVSQDTNNPSAVQRCKLYYILCAFVLYFFFLYL